MDIIKASVKTCVQILCSSACYMIIDDSLYVLFSLQLSPSGVVSRHSFGVHVDDLSVTLVLEQKTLLILSNHLKPYIFLL